MEFSSRLWLIVIGINLVVWGATADENQTDNSSKIINFSPAHFSFSKAIPVQDSYGLENINVSDRLDKNGSEEAYYNSISMETDTSLPHLNFMGIPMDCHFCP